MFIDLLAAFLDDPFHFVGFFRRQASERAGESRFPFYLADRLEPPDETGGHFQPVRRQRLQVLEDVIEWDHNSYGTPARSPWQATAYGTGIIGIGGRTSNSARTRYPGT
jgi:hypothetical protein